jgi:hypothetical protein
MGSLYLLGLRPFLLGAAMMRTVFLPGGRASSSADFFLARPSFFLL